jgi:hypothetical protein
MSESIANKRIKFDDPGRTMYPPRLRKFRYVSMMFGVLSAYLLVRHHYYLSTLSFAIAFIVIGQQLKWKKEHFRKIKSSRIWIIYVITWILAFYGLWFDFYAGSMFLFFGFILIGIESSRKEINWVNIILAIINISLSLIAFIMHLQYTVKLNF